MPAIRIDQLHLNDVAGIQSLHLSFGRGLNIVCGANGIGKSTVLESIATCFTPYRQSTVLKRRAGSKVSGSIRADVFTDNGQLSIDTQLTHWEPDKHADPFGTLDGSSSVIVLRAQRDFNYERKDSLLRDPTLDKVHNIQERIAEGSPKSELKQWLANRFLMEPHSEHWPDFRKANLNVVRELFSVLDPSVSFSHADSSTFEVFVDTLNGRIPFEYLSSGFRSAFILLIGIIKEIEFRELNVRADEFSGLILVDEIDVHLHPSWQKRICKVLKATFPSAQMIVTTHSPHVIQEADAQEVISLSRDGMGRTTKREMPVGEYGFLGWTIEEILEEAMGVDDTRTGQYRDAIKAFDSALDTGDDKLAIRSLEVLERLLHPSNPLRKILRIQAAGIEGLSDND